MFFEKATLLPPDPVFGLQERFLKDPRENKLDLSIGLYKDESLTTPILKCVKKAEERLFHEERTKAYLPIRGDDFFLAQIGRLIFDSLWDELDPYMAKMQTLGGTGALRCGASMIFQEVADTIHIPSPTWPNHLPVFKKAGLNVSVYPYYDPVKNEIDFDNFTLFLNSLPKRSVILLHAVCHNPTGADPTAKQWQTVAEIFKRKEHLPFFDCAYHGFGDSIEKDLDPIKLFVREKIPFLLAYSFAKNFGLYGERMGALFVMVEDKAIVKKLASQMALQARTTYSNPVLHGASIVKMILSDNSLLTMWKEELNTMRERLISMRHTLVSILSEKSDRYEFIKNKKGMFCLLNFDNEQLERLIQNHGLYLGACGRINFAALLPSYLEYVANAILGEMR